MKAAKSEGGLSRGRMRNSDSDHKSWLLTLSHISNVNQHMEEGTRNMLHPTETLPKHRRSEMLKQLNLSSHGSRRTIYSTMIETTRLYVVSETGAAVLVFYAK